MADDLEIHVYEDIFHVPGCVRPFRMLYHLKVVIDRSAKMASLGYNLHVSGKIAVGHGDLGVPDVFRSVRPDCNDNEVFAMRTFVVKLTERHH